MPDERLLEVLAHYPVSAQPIGPLTGLGGAGGLSGAVFWRFESPHGPRYLRAWPEQGPSADRLAVIHGWLSAAAELPFIPLPLPGRDGRTVQACAGRCWEVGPWMPGRPDLNQPPDPDHVAGAFIALARFHQCVSAHRIQRWGPSPGLGRRVRELAGLASGGFDDLERALRGAGEAEPVAQGREWIFLARGVLHQLLPRLSSASRLEVSLQPCLRDARPEHFLFDGGRVAGLIDFGAMDLETVAADLARLAGEWLGAGSTPRACALAAYERIRPLSDRELEIALSLEAAADVLIAGHWLRWHFLEGRRFEDPRAVRRGVERGLERLRRRAEFGGSAL